MNSHKDIQVDIDTDMSVHVGKDMDMGIDINTGRSSREKYGKNMILE